MTDTPTSYTGRPAGTPGTSDSVTQPSSDDPSTGDDKMEAAKDVARDVEQSGRRAVGSVADDAKAEARHLLRDAQAHVRSEADSQSRRAAESVRDVSGELRSIADNGESSYVTSLAGDGAKRLERLSERLETDGIDGVLDDVRSFARRRPGVFLAGCLGAGVVVGRLFHNADRDDLSEAMRSGASSTDETPDGSVNGSESGADGELAPPPAAISDPALPIHTDVTASNSAGRP